MGWSRTGISTAALLNFVCMGIGSFFWGALSDRIGTRSVVLLGGVLLGSRNGDGEPGGYSRSVPALLRRDRRLRGGQLLHAADGDDHPLVHAEPQSRGGAGLGGARPRLDDDGAARALDHHQLRLAHGHARDRRSRWLVIIPAAFWCEIRRRRRPPRCRADGRRRGRELTAAQALRTPQFAAIALTYFACCAAHSGPIFHMVTHAIDHGGSAMAAATVMSVAGLASLSGDRLRARRRPRRREACAGLRARPPGGGDEPLPRHPRALAVLRGRADVRVRLRRRDAALRDPRARILRRADMGTPSARWLRVHPGHGLGPWAGGWLYDAFGSYAWLFIGSAASASERWRSRSRSARPARFRPRGRVRSWPTKQIEEDTNGCEKRNTREAIRGKGSGGRIRARAVQRGHLSR